MGSEQTVVFTWPKSYYSSSLLPMVLLSEYGTHVSTAGSGKTREDEGRRGKRQEV